MSQLGASQVYLTEVFQGSGSPRAEVSAAMHCGTNTSRFVLFLAVAPGRILSRSNAGSRC
jgi:hypothetical protein